MDPQAGSRTSSIFIDEDPEPPSSTSSLRLTLSPDVLTASSEALFSPKPTPFAVLSGVTRTRPQAVISPAAREFRDRWFPAATDADWTSWRWQLAHRITRLDDLARFITLSPIEQAALNGSGGQLPLGITPYYAHLIDPDDPGQSIRRAVIPTTSELVRSQGEADDPLGEEGCSPVHGLVHRYPDRVLFLVTDYCSTYCRYCTRSRMVGRQAQPSVNRRQWENALDYIRRTPEVRDVLLSGGDPLTLSNDSLEWLLARLRQIPHVEMVRIGTKVPMVLPQRINRDLTSMLKRYHPLWMSIHVMHPDELTPEAAEATARLADAGIPLGSQTVLLKGVNDSVDTMKKLFQGLLKLRVKPYYLYQCDPITGSAHFRTPVKSGLDIIEGLRGHTSGYAVPSYVIDAPGGGGKIPLLPDYCRGMDGGDLVLRNYAGDLYRYPDMFVDA